ncbi:hypothetical protein ACN28S_48555 [Cystobacter fuscus]
MLRELGLGLMAADAFERVASLGEPGWSTEAKQRAEQLRRQVEAHQSAYASALAVGDAMRAGGPVPLEQARAFPGLFRLFFYDALRAASTRERTLELLPLAQALDTHEGQGTLVALVHHVAGRDFSRRGPLTREHDRLRRERGPPPSGGPSSSSPAGPVRRTCSWARSSTASPSPPTWRTTRRSPPAPVTPGSP